MNAVAVELDEVLERMEPAAAKRLELKVRSTISDAAKAEEEARALEEIKLRVPEIAHLIGAWADEDVEEPMELPLPPLKCW